MDITSLILFFIPLSFSPGPSNIICLTSGVNFGFKKTVPYISGAIFGFSLMVITVSLGIDSLFTQYPEIFISLQYIGGAYLFYLAWKITQSSPLKNKGTEKQEQPMTFFEAILFQWVNPKAWIMAINTIVLFLSPAEKYLVQMIFIICTLATILIINDSIWTLSGSMLQKLLSRPIFNKIFNYFMAGLLIFSVFLTIF